MNTKGIFLLAVSVVGVCTFQQPAAAKPKLTVIGGERELDGYTQQSFNNVVATRAVALKSGGFMATWLDYTYQIAGPYVYYTYTLAAQFFDQSGTTVASSALDSCGSCLANLTVSAAPVAFPDGSAMAVYSKGSNPPQQVYTQRFDAAGTVVGSPSALTNDGDSTNTTVSAALLPNKTAAALWERVDDNGYALGVADRIVRESGKGKGGAHKINKAFSQLFGVVGLTNSNFVFAYEWDTESGEAHRELVLLGSNGKILGSSKLPAIYGAPGLGALANGGYIAVFAVQTNGKTILEARTFSSDGSASPDVKLGTISPNTFQPQVAVEPGAGGRVLVLTGEFAASGPDIRVRALDQKGNLLFGPGEVAAGSQDGGADSLILMKDGSFGAFWNENVPDPDSGQTYPRPYFVRFTLSQ